jgi:hypothetical protein
LQLSEQFSLFHLYRADFFAGDNKVFACALFNTGVSSSKSCSISNNRSR